MARLAACIVAGMVVTPMIPAMARSATSPLVKLVVLFREEINRQRRDEAPPGRPRSAS
jgi:hypothetical protein